MVLLGDEEENLLLLLRDEQQIGSPLKEVKVKVLIGGIEKIDAHSREVFWCLLGDLACFLEITQPRGPAKESRSITGRF